LPSCSEEVEKPLTIIRRLGVSVFLKRAFDVVCAAAGLMFLSALLGWIAWCIKAEDGGPVFYRGVRVGLH